MDKELFISTMAKIEELHHEQEMFNDVLKRLDPEFGGGYINSKAIDTLVNLLKVLVDDEYDNIGYYIWELDIFKISPSAEVIMPSSYFFPKSSSHM